MDLKVPKYHEFEEFQNRSSKLKEIKILGVEPYPHHFKPTALAQALQSKYQDQAVGSSEEALEKKTDLTTISGRLMLFRAMGKNIFGQLQDESGRIQIMCSRDFTRVKGLISEEVTPLKFIEKKLDLGDLIGVEGYLFRTHKGELTVLALEVTLLCKTLLPLPEKHSGIADKGVLYRKRWLDLITNPESKAHFQMRSRIISATRRYLENLHFMEVETPVLQNIYGGAEARPFKTELHALHQEMFLRIALEISLKKLIVGGFSRIFEISKVFRNEGLDRTHNPEFTMLEAYAAYWDYKDFMVFVENLFEHLAMELYGTTVIGTRLDKRGNPHTIDLKAPWKRLTMKESLLHYAHIDIDKLSPDNMRDLLHNIDKKILAKASRGKLMSYLFEEYVEHHLIAPHHIIDHPIETTPLCKPHRNPHLAKEGLVERFETFILGTEFCNSYTELNDPELQRALLENQHEEKLAGNEEANPLDEDFIEAICQGMPPTGGLGIGMDRLTMLLTGAPSIRDVLYFPIMRSEE